jgi:proteic killer suppression protein
MIESFRHKGLRRFYENNDRKSLPPEMVERIRDILTMLEAAETLEGLSGRPSFRLHALKGRLKGFWAVTVRANWRIIFRFADGKASDVDFVDYH